MNQQQCLLKQLKEEILFQNIFLIMQLKLIKSSKSDYLLPQIHTQRTQPQNKLSRFKKGQQQFPIKNSISKSLTSENLTQKTFQTVNTCISNILKTVRNHYESSKQKIQEMSLLKLKTHNKTLKLQQKTKRLQKKVLSPTNPIYHKQLTNREQEETLSHYNQSFDKKLIISQISVNNKPPQRYKTQMVIYQGSIIFFGGIGCQQNLSWAKLSFNPQGLTLPERQIQNKIISNNTPIYGHTMLSYKQNAYIFGGVNSDILNELFVLNLKTMTLSNAISAPFRRKYHAACMVGKFMVVYGGIQENETKNTMFYFDTQNCEWSTVYNANLPCLSHHKMVVTGTKPTRKLADILQSNQTIYFFGGKDQKGICSNRLYKLKLTPENSQLKCEQVKLSEMSDYPPEKRYDFCFECLDNENILLYGGKNDSQKSDFDMTNGTFKDIYTFNIVRKAWKKHEIQVDFRHSMASVSYKGRVYIFGGVGDRFYSNANILMVKMGQKLGLSSLKSQDDLCSKENIPALDSVRRIGDF